MEDLEEEESVLDSHLSDHPIAAASTASTEAASTASIEAASHLPDVTIRSDPSTVAGIRMTADRPQLLHSR